jgi:hypothetical protein
MIPAALLAIAALFTVGRADVTADPGYSSISAPLTIRTDEDLSDYRFFIESPMRLEEIAVQKGDPTVIDPEGRAGAGRIVTIWAVPRKSITDESAFSDPSKLPDTDAALREGRIAGAVKLLTHSFQTTVSDEEKSSWENPVYRVIRDEAKGLAATRTGGQTTKAGQNAPVSGSTKSSDRPLQVALVGGAIFVLGAVGLGLWFLRRASKNQAV